MSRYIKFDAIKTRYRGGFHDDHVVDYDSIMNAPSIDLVRCKECKYASDNKVYGCMVNHFNDNDYDYHRMYANDFCSRGEREGE